VTARKAPVLRASWFATALAGLLAVTTPITASLAGDGAGGDQTPDDRTRRVPSLAQAADRPASGIERARASTTPEVRPAARDSRAAPPNGREANRAVREDRRASSAPVERPEAGRREAEATTPRAGRTPHLLVAVPSGGLTARRNPWVSAPSVGRVVSSSRYYHVPTVAWVEDTNSKDTWGRVELPYAFPRREGWIRLSGLRRDTTWVSVKIDLSAHRVTVWKMGQVVLRTAGATGAPASPTPPGDYFVTDRVPFPAGGALGSFAFGISGVQPALPAGWTGGDQLAVHGTNAPWTIGTSASAGCVRVSGATLARMKPMLDLGTPVVIVP
jgi:hypothetical protein